MRSVRQMFLGEQSITKVAGLFPSKPDAVAALQDLLQVTGLTPAQVRLLEPSDGVAVRAPVFDQAVEQEDAGIWGAVVRAHVSMGLLGAFIGCLLYLGLMMAEHPTFISTPRMSLVVLTSFGVIVGLLIGGALVIRPDHGWLATLIRRGLQEGLWAVVAHPVNAEQTYRAMDVLMPGSVRVARSC